MYQGDGRCTCPGDCACGWVAKDYPNICCCPLTVAEHDVPPLEAEASR